MNYNDWILVIRMLLYGKRQALLKMICDMINHYHFGGKSKFSLMKQVISITQTTMEYPAHRWFTYLTKQYEEKNNNSNNNKL